MNNLESKIVGIVDIFRTNTSVYGVCDKFVPYEFDTTKGTWSQANDIPRSVSYAIDKQKELFYNTKSNDFLRLM
jgi:predicted CoA-binding protein